MSEPELKPCPFCGNAATLTHGELTKIPRANRLTFASGDYSLEWTVSCSYCGMAQARKRGAYILDRNGNLVDAEKIKARDEIIKSWNRRAGSQQDNDEDGGAESSEK